MKFRLYTVMKYGETFYGPTRHLTLAAVKSNKIYKGYPWKIRTHKRSKIGVSVSLRLSDDTDIVFRA